jgi:hypothetical protein
VIHSEHNIHTEQAHNADYPMAILRVSKQIHEEAADYFYSANHFYINGESLKKIRPFFVTIGQQNCKRIRKLRMILRYPPWDPPHVASVKKFFEGCFVDGAGRSLLRELGILGFWSHGWESTPA